MTEAQVIVSKRRLVDQVIAELRHEALTSAQLQERLGRNSGSIRMALGRLHSVGLALRTNDAPPRWRLTRPL